MLNDGQKLPRRTDKILMFTHFGQTFCPNATTNIIVNSPFLSPPRCCNHFPLSSSHNQPNKESFKRKQTIWTRCKLLKNSSVRLLWKWCAILSCRSMVIRKCNDTSQVCCGCILQSKHFTHLSICKSQFRKRCHLWLVAIESGLPSHKRTHETLETCLQWGVEAQDCCLVRRKQCRTKAGKTRVRDRRRRRRQHETLHFYPFDRGRPTTGSKTRY